MKQIHCPHCRQLIDIENALAHDLTQEFRAKLAEERKQIETQAAEKMQKERETLERTLAQQFDDRYRPELESLRQQDESRTRELQVLKQEELALRKEKQRLEELQESAELEVQRRVDEERKAIEENARLREREHSAVQFKHHEQTLESLRLQVEGFKAQELQLLTEKQRLEDLHSSLQLEVQRKIDEERISIEEKARREEREQASHQIKEKDQTLDSLRQQVEAHRTKELQLLKENQTLEEMSQSAELNLQRQLDEERKNIAEKARLQEREQAMLQLKQKDQTLEALREQLEVMKRKAEQGSQQAQGEVQEVELENILTSLFPLDTILEVHKGVNGADIVHTIMSNAGKRCGAVSIESKRTKAFSDKWIEKLKEDMLRHGCELGVIVTEAMPEGQAHIVQVERNIWICPFAEFKGLAFALRDSLLRVDAVKTVQGNSREKMKLLYDYLTSSEFKQQLEIIFGGFRALEENLAKERRAMQKLWKEREKQLDKVYTNALDFYGAISGIAGADVPALEALALEAPHALAVPSDSEA